MRGNIYISLTTDAYKGKMPPLCAERYAFNVTDDEGNSERVLPTFEQWCESRGSVYGRNPIKLDIGRRNLYVVELDASHLAGEVRELKNLGTGMDYPLNSVLTASEAQELINQYTSAE